MSYNFRRKKQQEFKTFSNIWHFNLTKSVARSREFFCGLYVESIHNLCWNSPILLLGCCLVVDGAATATAAATATTADWFSLSHSFIFLQLSCVRRGPSTAAIGLTLSSIHNTPRTHSPLRLLHTFFVRGFFRGCLALLRAQSSGTQQRPRLQPQPLRSRVCVGGEDEYQLLVCETKTAADRMQLTASENV